MITLLAFELTSGIAVSSWILMSFIVFLYLCKFKKDKLFFFEI